MQARPGPVFDPERYTRGYSREQIVDHLRETLEIVAELDPPEELLHDVFAVAQTMVSSLEPVSSEIPIADGATARKLGIIGGRPQG